MASSKTEAPACVGVYEVLLGRRPLILTKVAIQEKNTLHTKKSEDKRFIVEISLKEAFKIDLSTK